MIPTRPDLVDVAEDKFPTPHRASHPRVAQPVDKAGLAWELCGDFSGGLGHVCEKPDSKLELGYAFASGLDCTGTATLGPTLFSARRGVLLPPAAETTAGALGTIKRFIEFNGALYGVTSATPGVIYQWDPTGVAPSVVETLSAACTQLFSDGAILYAAQGPDYPCRVTADGTSWEDGDCAANAFALRDEAILASVWGATLVPGLGYPDSVPIGWPTTTAVGMVFLDGALFVGKPEGLFLFKLGRVSCIFPTGDHLAADNFSHMVVHQGLLYFNVGCALFYTNGAGRFVPVYPDNTNGFEVIDDLFPTFGPLLISARMRDAALTLRSFLLLFDGPDRPGLNPLWSDADGSRPIVGCGATNVFDTTKTRVYLSQTTTGEKWLNLTRGYEPNAYHVKGTVASFIDLLPFTAGARGYAKIFSEVRLQVRNPNATTFAQVWYSLDGGTWTQTLDAPAGSMQTLALSAGSAKTYLPPTVMGVALRLRVYLWTTSASSAAGISDVIVMAKLQ